MTYGMSRDDGKPLSGQDHLEQSVADILTTPIGTRCMNREYGSKLFELVDKPINQFTLVDFYAATITALMKWEKRIRVTKVSLSNPAPGQIFISVDGVNQLNGEDVTIAGIQL